MQFKSLESTSNNGRGRMRKKRKLKEKIELGVRRSSPGINTNLSEDG